MHANPHSVRQWIRPRHPCHGPDRHATAGTTGPRPDAVFAFALKRASDQAKAMGAPYDAFATKLTATDDKGKVPLAAIVLQDAVRAKLKAGACLTTAKMSGAGGTSYTRQNRWSFFGTMPFFTRSGVVVRYNLMNGRTGAVIAAGAVPLDGGFFKVNHMPREIVGP